MDKEVKPETNIRQLKGLTMIFFWSGAPMNPSFQRQGNIHINQKKQQNPCKIAEIMKKTGFLASFIIGGALSSVFQFPKICVLL